MTSTRWSSDGHILWVVDGYTTTDQYPQSERDSFSDMTTDVVNQPPGVRTLPTDQINYMRNAVKATVDAYTGEVKLYAWDETDPILQAWGSAFPNTVLDRDQIPSDLLAHLRYPEDMFKVQRFQYARYHVTDSERPSTRPTTSGRSRRTPYDKDKNQAPIRMFTPNPADRRPDVVADVELRAEQQDATCPASSPPTPIRRRPTTARSPSSSRAARTCRGRRRRTATWSRIRGSPARSSRSGSVTPRPSYGNVVSVPLAGGLMYVVPVYATRQQTSTSSYLSLRYVMVSFGQKVGIGDTLVDAIADMVGTAAPPDNTGDNGNNGTHHPHAKGAMAKAHALLEKAQADFAAADEALANGKAADWVRLNHKARAEVAKALNLLR